MGDVTVVWFGILGLIGLALIGVGTVRRVRTLVVAGSALLLALVGAWIFGPSGVLLGILALALLWRGRN